MIESIYWKEELTRIAKTIQPVVKPKRWTERAACIVERDVMIGFFIVRRMIELKKVSSKIAKMRLEVFSSPVTKKITWINSHKLDENYDWKAEKTEYKPTLYICNQFIHAYFSFVLRGLDRNWADMIIVSDFDRNKTVWRIACATISDLFEAASKDRPTKTEITFDPSPNDYKTITD